MIAKIKSTFTKKNNMHTIRLFTLWLFNQE